MKVFTKNSVINVFQLRKKLMKQYFSNITKEGIVTNSEFWRTMEPFITNKDCLDDSDIMLRGDNEIIID